MVEGVKVSENYASDNKRLETFSLRIATAAVVRDVHDSGPAKRKDHAYYRWDQR
eukprot:CAMPEP_0170176192 /NCGR_PEP_ID=MMETSP0040_2-20121228/9133_1 /TAXON_ID=641309 /ORGANISM="Lotharella oceanica, Strain CCMP622" /LENGTH=53 /DNA_ID=CAMNT_0010418439 /DNA_START=604 /DNA_END=765 /DNA_ORIENTATION=-